MKLSELSLSYRQHSEKNQKQRDDIDILIDAMTKMQQQNKDMEEKISTMKDEIIFNMMSKSMNFLKIDSNSKYMIDTVQYILLFKMVTDDSNEGLNHFKLHFMLKELSQQLKFKEFQVEEIQQEMKDLKGHKINNFEELKQVLRKLFARQKEFRDDW